MSTQKPTILKRKSTWIIAAALTALCLICLIIGAIYNATPQGKAASTERAQTTATAQAVALIPTDTLPPVDTNTPAPTRTTAPTNTPKPTLTPTPIPQPIEFSGTGDDVISIEKSYGPAIAKITYTGARNFIIKNYDANGETIDLMVNTIGAYAGTRPLDFYDNQQTDKIEIKASGDWTITIYPLAEQYLHTCDNIADCSGKGDDVIAFFKIEPDTAAIINQGEGNFIVKSYGSSDIDLVVNEIGNYTGKVIFDRGVFLIEIISGGSWKFDITPR